MLFSFRHEKDMYMWSLLAVVLVLVCMAAAVIFIAAGVATGVIVPGRVLHKLPYSSKNRQDLHGMIRRLMFYTSGGEPFVGPSNRIYYLIESDDCFGLGVVVRDLLFYAYVVPTDLLKPVTYTQRGLNDEAEGGRDDRVDALLHKLVRGEERSSVATNDVIQRLINRLGDDITAMDFR